MWTVCLVRVISISTLNKSRYSFFTILFYKYPHSKIPFCNYLTILGQVGAKSLLGLKMPDLAQSYTAIIILELASHLVTLVLCIHAVKTLEFASYLVTLVCTLYPCCNNFGIC